MKQYSRGSIHSDEWQGTAIDLAQKGLLAVYPIGGWWKDSTRWSSYDKSVTYALVVTLETDEEVDIDLYEEVRNAIATQSRIEVEV